MHFLIFIVIITITTILALVIYKRQSVFNIVVYEAPSATKVFDYQNSKLIFRIKPKIRSKINAVLTMADPFLFVHNDELYLFRSVSFPVMALLAYPISKLLTLRLEGGAVLTSVLESDRKQNVESGYPDRFNGNIRINLIYKLKR